MPRTRKSPKPTPPLAQAPITPLRIPRSARGIILFGGAFDPPHKWHTRVAVAARRRLFPRDGWIVFVPAGRSPLKAGPVAPAADRVAMLRLAAARLKRVRIWTDEIDRAEHAAAIAGGNAPSPAASEGSVASNASDRGGRRYDSVESALPPSYTIDTVRRLRQLLPADLPIRLLIGADQAVQFHRWRDFRELMSLAEPVVVPRPPIRSAERLRASLRSSGAWSRVEIGVWSDRLAPFETSDDSSTKVRALTRRGSIAVGHTSRAVWEFLRRRGLYAARP